MARRTALLLTTLTLLVVLAGCGATGGNDHADATPAQLEAILPTADDVGADYELDESDEDDSTDNDADGDGTDDDMADACPALAELSLEGSAADNEDEVTRSFTADDDRSVEVSLDPTPADLTEDKVAELVDAVNECGTVDLSDDESTMTMDLSAELDDSFGDYGVRLTIGANVEAMAAEAQGRGETQNAVTAKTQSAQRNFSGTLCDLCAFAVVFVCFATETS